MYVVSWRYNNQVRTEEFEFYTIALIKMIQLESWGMKPTLHEK